MQRVCDHRGRIFHEAPQFGIQCGILDREAVFHVSNDFALDLEGRVLFHKDKDADLGPKGRLD
jgi:hypothetical protein